MPMSIAPLLVVQILGWEGLRGNGETLPRHSLAQCASYMISFLGKQIV